jgi:8-oxo-dGTP pyrophosphatase MutT (NUDIX family)
MNKRDGNAHIRTHEQVSAGGVVYRGVGTTLEIAIVQVVSEMRWQLPKGIIDEGETREEAAIREVREEAGVEVELVAPIDTIEYWFTADYDGESRRYHKFVHF